MATDPGFHSAELARLIAARDAALQHYAEYQEAARLRTSDWCALRNLSRGAARPRVPVPARLSLPYRPAPSDVHA